MGGVCAGGMKSIRKKHTRNLVDSLKYSLLLYKTRVMIADNQTISSQIKTAVLSVDPAAEVILFGSRARGDSRSDSDWDVLILVGKDEITWEYEREFRHKLYDIELSISQPISVFVYSKKDWIGRFSVTPLFEAIQSEGIII